jgi:hypothetical protein
MSVPSNLHKYLRDGYYTRIINGMEIELRPRFTPGATVKQTENGWRLDVPGGAGGTYRLAQLDDYATKSRRDFMHIPPWSLNLRARVSETNLPGTWGFGLWNDPFGISLGFGGTAGRLPTPPNTAWFFHGSPPNWLSLRDGIPANGFFAGTIQSPRIPNLLLPPSLLALPLLAIRPISRFMRKMVAKIILQESAVITTDVTKWHEYTIDWLRERVEFKIDDKPILRTSTSPNPPLGLVIWIDNQYGAWTPEGRLNYGKLDNPSAWLEFEFS